MRVSVYVYKQYSKPSMPWYVARFYAERASAGEGEGWSDWSPPGGGFYKFKYSTGNGVRLVFIVPREAGIGFDEFRERAEESRWFAAAKVYARTGVAPAVGWSKQDNDRYRLPLGDVVRAAVVEALSHVLTGREAMVYSGSLERWVEAVVGGVLHVVRGSPVNGAVNVYVSGEQGLVVEYVFKERFAESKAVWLVKPLLPFTLTAHVYLYGWDWGMVTGAVPLREYVKFLANIMEVCRRWPSPPDTILRPEGLATALVTLWKKSLLRPCWREKTIAWLHYWSVFGLK